MTVSQNTMSNLLITQFGRQIVWSPCYIPVMDMCQGEASLPLWGLPFWERRWIFITCCGFMVRITKGKARERK